MLLRILSDSTEVQDKEWYVQLWETIAGWLQNIGRGLDDLILKIFNIDEFLWNGYNDFIQPLPEIVKIIGFAFIALLLLFGLISLIKKSFKLIIIIAVIILIFYLMK